jgi:hypothetical protein
MRAPWAYARCLHGALRGVDAEAVACRTGGVFLQTGGRMSASSRGTFFCFKANLLRARALIAVLAGLE